jgi:hypothetical protein
MRKNLSFLIIFSIFVMILIGCGLNDSGEPTSMGGVKPVVADVKAGKDGMTVEQRNVKTRLELENDPTSIKHLYVISAYSGQVIIYSTAKGKITSSGKRLSPYTIASMDGQSIGTDHEGFQIEINGKTHHTGEVLQDDGTYGHSIPYIFWFDINDVYHQHYLSGGQILHISDQPLDVKSVLIRIGVEKKE